MKNNPTWFCAVLIAALIAPGPLAPIAANAQVAMQPEVPQETAPQPPGKGAQIGAGFLNVVYVPGKAIVCGAGTIIAGGFMLLTFGSAYREAVSFFNEGCGGPWLLTAEQVAAAPKTVQFEY